MEFGKERHAASQLWVGHPIIVYFISKEDTFQRKNPYKNQNNKQYA